MRTAIARGDLLRELRRDKSMTLRDVSAKSFVALGYLSEIETGDKQPSDEILERIVSVLDLTMSEFFWLMSMRIGGVEWQTSLSKQYSLQLR